MTENPAIFLADFGTDATWSGGGTVRGIFDSGFQAAQLGLDVGIEGARYTYLVPTADMPGVAHGHTLVIGGTTYTVRGVQPDGTGWTLLVLHA